MASIFLCHSSRDKLFVRKLADALREADIKVWLDEAEINIGDSLTEMIGKGLQDVNFVGVVLSSNSIDSAWVQRELAAALDRELREGKVVLPILLERVELPIFLRDKMYADFTDDERFAETFRTLLRTLGTADSERATLDRTHSDKVDTNAVAFGFRLGLALVASVASTRGECEWPPPESVVRHLGRLARYFDTEVIFAPVTLENAFITWFEQFEELRRDVEIRAGKPSGRAFALAFVAPQRLQCGDDVFLADLMNERLLELAETLGVRQEARMFCTNPNSDTLLSLLRSIRSDFSDPDLFPV